MAAGDFGGTETFNTVLLSEYGNRTTGYRIEYWSGGEWRPAHVGTSITSGRLVSFPAVSGSRVRILFTAGTGQQPILYEFGIYNRTATHSLQGLRGPSPSARFTAHGEGGRGRMAFLLELESPSFAEITVADTHGRETAMLGRGSFQAGTHVFRWEDGSGEKVIRFAVVRLPGAVHRVKSLAGE